MWFRSASLLREVVKRTPTTWLSLVPYPRAQFHAYTPRLSPANKLGTLTKDFPIFHARDPLSLITSKSPGTLSAEQCIEFIARNEWEGIWIALLEAPNIVDRLEHARLKAARGPAGFGDSQDISSGISIEQLPPWLPIFVLYHKAATSKEIISSVEFIWSYLRTQPPNVSHTVTVLTVARLAERRFTASLRRFIWSFCDSPHLPSANHCNLLLGVLSLHPRNGEAGRLADRVLQFMSEYGLTVQNSIYDALLHRRFATLRVAAAVRRKMAQERRMPTQEQLESLFHLMVAHRQSKAAAGYLNRLRQSQLKTNAEAVAYGSHPRPSGVDRAHSTPHNYRFIRSFRRISAALGYLRKLNDARVVDASLRKGKSRHIRRIWRQRNWRVTLEEWVSGLYIASRSKDIDSEGLLAAFRKGEKAFPHSRQAYSTVTRGLLYKRDYAGALALWDEASSKDLPLDTVSLGIGVHTLAMNGEALRAFQLLEQVHASRQSWLEQRANRHEHERRPDNSVRPAVVNLHAVHQYMTGLQRMGRPDVVFTLWDHMHTLYGLLPDVYSINILLQTAKWARKFEDTIKGQLAYLGFGKAPTLPRPESPSEARAQAAGSIYTLLDPRRRPWITGRWNNEPAGRAALRLVTQIFVGNWPELRDVASPVRALRRSAADVSTMPLRETINTVLNRAPYEHSPLYDLLPQAPDAAYPSIMPTDVTFRAFVDLLAVESLKTEIPLVLAWMRALQIWPSKVTLATALVHWSDVSMDAPLMAKLRGNAGRDPYTLLMHWMEGWVGPKRMPSRDDMKAEMRRAAYYRDTNYLQIIKERNAEASRHKGT